jgi:hypothetical protein
MKRVTQRALTTLAVAAALLPAASAIAGPTVDLTVVTEGTINAPVGGTAVYTLADTLPAGTGVFDPFLTIQNKGTEMGYNTSQGGNGQGYMDTKRVPQWTHDLHVGDLATITRNGIDYYGFELDANETGSGNIDRLLSVDNIRIYTSSTDTATTVGSNIKKLESLGTLRYAQNDPTLSGNNLNVANWVKIDASRYNAPPGNGGSTSGSGSSDLLVLIPKAAFGNAAASDFVYFFNLNGAQFAADDPTLVGLTSEAGFEEWRAVVGSVPDGGSTLMLLGSALTALGFVRGRRTIASKA